MNDNELINTAVSGFTPYQFNPQSPQLMPTAFDRTASRTEQRISDTQKRVNQLVQLDPTNPLALMVTMLGANQNRGLRDDLMSLRGQAFKSDAAQKKRKKILADIKALDYGDALGIYAREKHGSDIDATLNDPNLMDGLEEIKTRKEGLSINEEVKLIDQMANAMNEIIKYKKIGGDNPEFLSIQQGIFDKGMAILRGKGYSKEQIDEAMGTVSPTGPQSTIVDRPPPPAGFNQQTETVTPGAVGSTPNKKDQIKSNLNRRNAPPKVSPTEGAKVKPTGMQGILHDVQKNIITPADKMIRSGTVLKTSLGKASDAINQGEGDFPVELQHLKEQGWTRDAIPLKLTGKKPRVGDPIYRREVFFHNSTGIYVGESPQVDKKKKWFVGDVNNGVQRSFATRDEAFAFAATYKPNIPKQIKPDDMTGTDATGSADLTKPPPVQKKKKDIPKIISTDHRTEEEKKTKPWERTYLGDKINKVLDFINPIGEAEGATTNDVKTGSGSNIISSTGGSNVGGVGKAGKRYGGFAGRNPVATSVEQFRSNPFVESMVRAESDGNERAIGYKLVEKKDANGNTKLVYAKDKKGNKIPSSYGLMQVTIKTALSTKAGQELMRGLNPNNKEDKEKIKEILFDPYNNLKIATEFANRLRDQLGRNKYAANFSELEFNQLISAAYNYKGENFSKDVLDKYKPSSMKELLHKAYIPKETRRQIRVVGKYLRKVGM